MHVRNKICKNNSRTIHIVEFLRQTIRDNPGKIIDIFLEVGIALQGLEEREKRDRSQFGVISDATRRREYEQQGAAFQGNAMVSTNYLTDLRSAFYDCLQRNKEACPDRVTRFHYADNRNLDVLEEATLYSLDVNDLSNMLAKIRLFQGTSGIMGRQIPPEVLAELDAVKKDVLDKGIEIAISLHNDINEFYQRTRISKQLENIRDPEFVAAFHRFFDHRIMSGMLQFKDAFQRIDMGSSAEEVSELGHKLLFSVSLLMDAYTVARMFRSFRNQRGYSNQDPQYIIEYAGLLHIETVVDFFESIPDMMTRVGVDSYSATQGSDFQCLTVNAKLPFFQDDQAAVAVREDPLYAALRDHGSPDFIEAIKGTRYEVLLKRGGYTIFAPYDPDGSTWKSFDAPSARTFYTQPAFDDILKCNLVDRKLTLEDLRRNKAIPVMSRIKGFTYHNVEGQDYIKSPTDTDDGLQILETVVVGNNIIHFTEGLLAGPGMVEKLKVQGEYPIDSY